MADRLEVYAKRMEVLRQFSKAWKVLSVLEGKKHHYLPPLMRLNAHSNRIIRLLAELEEAAARAQVPAVELDITSFRAQLATLNKRKEKAEHKLVAAVFGMVGPGPAQPQNGGHDDSGHESE